MSSTKSITAIFCRNHTLGSFLIRWLGSWGGKWSHVAIVSECSTYVIEARYPVGVVKTDLKDFLARYTASDLVEIECPDPKSALLYAESRIGTAYDWRAIVGMIIKEPIAKLSSDFCNELLEDSLIVGGRKRFRVPTRSVTVEQSYRTI